MQLVCDEFSRNDDCLFLEEKWKVYGNLAWSYRACDYTFSVTILYPNRYNRPFELMTRSAHYSCSIHHLAKLHLYLRDLVCLLYNRIIDHVHHKVRIRSNLVRIQRFYDWYSELLVFFTCALFCGNWFKRWIHCNLQFERINQKLKGSFRKMRKSYLSSKYWSLRTLL